MLVFAALAGHQDDHRPMSPFQQNHEHGTPPPGTSRMAARHQMIGPDEALQLVLGATVCQPPRSVPLEETCGLRLAQEVAADSDYPPFPRAMMDGYAVRTADAGRTVLVVGEVAAGHVVQMPVTEGRCLEIMTGACCPAGTEAVVQKEHVHRDGDRVRLPKRIASGSHIAPRGSECRAGLVILRPGDVVTPLTIAVLASLGLKEVLVTRRPSLAVITTGAELIPLGEHPGPGQIRDSNGPMLVAMARDMGIHRPIHLHAQDRLEPILEALRETATSDVVLLTGGVSVGNYDLVPAALEDYGAEAVFHKVMQKPGKPLLLARKSPQLIFGLPGNPLACHLCFHRYVAAAIRRMEHKSPAPGPELGELTRPVDPKQGRTYFVAAQAEAAFSQDIAWRLSPLPGASSADVFSPCRANCYLEVPPGNEQVPAGAMLWFTWIGAAPWSN